MSDSKEVASERWKSTSHTSLLLTTSHTHVPHEESRTSAHRSQNQSSSARILEENDQKNSALLSNDFVLMLDCSPSPEDVFCENTPEFRTSWLWLNKLTTLHCHTLYDLRMRNAYMSHFIVCLNQRRLTGVFEQPPPVELTWLDFSEKQTAQQSANPTEMPHLCDLNESSLAAVNSPSSHGCCGNRSTSEYWDAFSNCRRPSGGTTDSIPKAQLCRRRQLLRSVPMTSDDEVRQLYRNHKVNFRLSNSTSSAAKSSTSRSLSSPSKFLPSRRKPNAFRNAGSQKSPEEARQRMIELMEIIRMELRGEPDPDNKDLLEEELKRYREFFEQHLQDNSDFEPHLSDNSNSERAYMLLNMQKDLIRMLKEDFA
ncbi:uncharacterized protein LOC120450070 [Drosophila santomea]|uniref:uncharacterized protein LOC120450070 n=1 Tax=Drosophila santomea TaxID=129105 RepID=UPI00195356AA|nr:uncharacterized protein LOC120450070 [Drosophila santomea]